MCTHTQIIPKGFFPHAHGAPTFSDERYLRACFGEQGRTCSAPRNSRCLVELVAIYGGDISVDGDSTHVDGDRTERCNFHDTILGVDYV